VVLVGVCRATAVGVVSCRAAVTLKPWLVALASDAATTFTVRFPATGWARVKASTSWSPSATSSTDLNWSRVVGFRTSQVLCSPPVTGTAVGATGPPAPAAGWWSA